MTRAPYTGDDGYLPALVSSFTSSGAKVSITNFGVTPPAHTRSVTVTLTHAPASSSA